MAEPIRIIGVVGAGVMGRGIAHLMARGGRQTFLFDMMPGMAAKAKATILAELEQRVARGKAEITELKTCGENIVVVGDLAEFAQCELVIEAIIETRDAKTDLFRNLETICSATCILATNTSSLSVTEIADALQYRERFAGLHFFNPATVMKLVEVVSGSATADATRARLDTLATDLGKTPVEVRDSPGFLVNRCARPFYGEALRMLEEGVAAAATIDACLKSMGGFPLGPFELIDLVGVDINLNATRSIWRAFGRPPRFKPSAILEQLVAEGRLGRKSGTGFFVYPRGPVEQIAINDCNPEIFQRVGAMLVNEAAFAFEEKLASAEAINTAVKLGLNFKQGPRDLARSIGIPTIIDTLKRCALTDTSGRYVISGSLADFAG